MKTFLCNSYVDACHLFLILLLLGPYHFCPSSCSSLHEMFPWCIIFLMRSLVFPILLFSSISLHWPPRKAFLTFLAILWNSAFKWVYLSFSLLFFSQLFVRPPQIAILLFCISFSWRWFWLLPSVQCYESPSIIVQAICLSDLIPWTHLSLQLYNC